MSKNNIYELKESDMGILVDSTANNKLDYKNEKVIPNNHDKKTMALLKDLLDRKGWNQRQLAKELHKDTTTINRWAKNSRDIKWDQAEDIAKVIGCHPIEVYTPKKEVPLKYYFTESFKVQKIDKEDQQLIQIPYEYYHKNIKAIQSNIPGSFIDGEIMLFDIPKIKKFSSLAISKLCYCEPSKDYKKRFKNISDVVGVLTSNADFTLSVINPLNRQPVLNNITPKDLDLATPVKVKYNPLLINQLINT